MANGWVEGQIVVGGFGDGDNFAPLSCCTDKDDNQNSVGGWISGGPPVTLASISDGSGGYALEVTALANNARAIVRNLVSSKCKRYKISAKIGAQSGKRVRLTVENQGFGTLYNSTWKTGNGLSNLIEISGDFTTSESTADLRIKLIVEHNGAVVYAKDVSLHSIAYYVDEFDVKISGNIVASEGLGKGYYMFMYPAGTYDIDFTTPSNVECYSIRPAIQTKEGVVIPESDIITLNFSFGALIREQAG